MRVFHTKINIFSCFILLSASLAWAGRAAAVCVVSCPGPFTFDGVDDYVVLPNVSIGEEGTVSLQFKAHDTAGTHNLWQYSDVVANTDEELLAEYRIMLTQNYVWSELWPAGCSSGFGVSFPLTDTANWHTVSMSWKNGHDIVLRFDGQEGTFPIAYENGTPYTLPAFTSTTGSHVLGCGPMSSPTPPIRFFDGEMRNLVIYNTYQTPEPSVLILAATGLASLLAYALQRKL
jgi:hypothetical protein